MTGQRPAWTVIDLAEVTADPRFPGMEAARSEGGGLVGATAATRDGPTVILNGHVDVVPPGQLAHWATGPFSPHTAGGVVYGRGSCDMKGGLVCQLAALRVLRQAGVRLRGQVLMQTVVGEEDGGLGTFATLRRGHTGDVAIISEPTSANLVTACAGALTFRLLVPGKSVHASARTSGVDAIAKSTLINAVLSSLEARRDLRVHPLMSRYDIAYPVSIGTIRAGDGASSVPDLLVAEVRLGVALDEDVDAARAELEATVAQVCATDSWLREHRVVRRPVRARAAAARACVGAGDRGRAPTAARRAGTGVRRALWVGHATSQRARGCPDDPLRPG